MSTDTAHQYTIDLKQGDLFIQLSSIDVHFIARQMERWYEVMLDDTYVPVTIPSGEFVIPEMIAAPPPEEEQPSQPLEAENGHPEQPVSNEQEALLSQIKLLQDQVQRLMVDKAASPSIMPEISATPASNPVDDFVTPAHQDIQQGYEAPSPVSSSFEQPVDNPSTVVHNLVTDLPLEAPTMPAQQEVSSFDMLEQALVENPATSAPVALAEPLTAGNAVPSNDLDSLLDSLMTDLDQKSKPAAPAPVAQQPTPLTPSSFESVFNQAMVETPETETAPWEEETTLPTSPPPIEVLESLLSQTAEPSPTLELELPPVPAAPALPEPVATPPEPAQGQFNLDAMPAPLDESAMPPKSEWDNLSKLSDAEPTTSTPTPPPEEDLLEGLYPPFPTPEVAEQAEKGFGIPGPPPTDDPKIRKLSLEKLQSKPANMEDFVSPFPKSKEEQERDAEEAAQKAAAEAEVAAAEAAAVASVAAQQQDQSIESDLFGAFGAPPEKASVPEKDDEVFGAFSEDSTSPKPVVPPLQPVQHKGPLPQVEALNELCDMAPRATSGGDFMLLTAFYLNRFKELEKFALKDINTQLLRAGLTPVDHALLENVIANGYVQLIPDLTGTAHAAEYILTPDGELYVDSMLNY